jgi:phosphosulfolactate synthase
MRSGEYLRAIGVRQPPPSTTVFDPGYDPATLESHLDQSAELMATLKISMSCWMIASESATRRKVLAARSHGVPTVAGGGPFEIAVAQDALPSYLELCAEVGFDRIECGESFTELSLSPAECVREAGLHGLEVEYEMGEKHGGAFDAEGLDAELARAQEWVEAGARRIVVEARESARDVGLFTAAGEFQGHLAERVAEAFGLEHTLFEAPNKASQFALIDHFGAEVRLGNVRLEELLRVEIYRRGLHCDAFANPRLRPSRP